MHPERGGRNNFHRSAGPIGHFAAERVTIGQQVEWGSQVCASSGTTVANRLSLATSASSGKMSRRATPRRLYDMTSCNATRDRRDPEVRQVRVCRLIQAAPRTLFRLLTDPQLDGSGMLRGNFPRRMPPAMERSLKNLAALADNPLRREPQTVSTGKRR
jgi:hypothetical protein